MRFLWEHKWIFLLVLALIAAMIISVAALLNPGYAVGVSNVLGGVLRPVQNATGAFTDWVSSLFGDQDQIDELVAENQRLRRYIAQVDAQARSYEQTQAENERLRDLLGLSQRRRDFQYTAATVVARDLDNYARTFTLSKGTQHGVEPGMVAITEEGQMVGVISEAGNSWSTLRTIVDADFVCGAYIYRPGIDGVCNGQFAYMRSNLTTMIGLTPDMDIRAGDAVLTSGSDSGSLYPRDLELGTVREVLFDQNGMTATAIIEPSVDLRHIEQVFLLISFESEE